MTDSWGNSKFAHTYHRGAEKGRKERKRKKNNLKEQCWKVQILFSNITLQIQDIMNVSQTKHRDPHLSMFIYSQDDEKERHVLNTEKKIPFVVRQNNRTF